MKALSGSVMHCNRKAMPSNISLPGKSSNLSLILFLLLLVGLLSTGCRKDVVNTDSTEIQAVSSQSIVGETQVLSNYTGHSALTMWQLQQARAASARYLNFDNAIRDGYVDINVVVPNMGYHFLKGDNLDINFDFRKPEILVYNMEHNGKMRLVAVEYAVPINLTPNTAPDGFAGASDVWDRNTGFGLWLLHAWVWAYNSNGVFNPTNPDVHLH